MPYRDRPKPLHERVFDIEEKLRGLTTQVVTTRVTSDHGSLAGLSDDDHPQYQLRSEQGAAYPDLVGGVVPDDQLPADLLHVGDVTATADLELLAWISLGMGA